MTLSRHFCMGFLTGILDPSSRIAVGVILPNSRSKMASLRVLGFRSRPGRPKIFTPSQVFQSADYLNLISINSILTRLVSKAIE